MQADDEFKNEKRSEFRGGDNISKLQRRMYSRERRGFLPWRRRRMSTTVAATTPGDWDYQDDVEGKGYSNESITTSQTPKNPHIRVLFIVSIVFFVISIIGAMTYLFIGTSKIKSDTLVRVAVEGVSSIGSGSVVELQVLVINGNDESIELADLIVEYPDGTVSPVDFKTPLLGERIPLGKIEPLSARRGAIRAVVFGSNGSTVDIKIELQYRVKGSSALHSRVTEHMVLISSDAMGITVEGDTELTPGQVTPVTISVKSYSNTLLSGVYLDAAIPFGFTIIDSSPSYIEEVSTEVSNSNNRRWVLGNLRPGEERVVYISVEAAGQVGDKRYVQFSTGSGLNVDSEYEVVDDEHITILASKEYTVEIHKPFLDVYLESRGTNLSNVIAHSGRDIEVTIKWFNNLTVPINDAAIKITLGGSALNKAQIRPSQGGFYRSVDSLLLWDAKTTKDKMKVIAPGQSGEFKFRITPLSSDYLQKIRTPELTFGVHVTGKRFSESNVPEELVAESSYEVKVATNVLFNSYALFKSSPFGAIGSIPPKVEYETQYAVVWEVSNTTSDLEDAVVRADLPHYVRWIGLTSPANEQVIYNKVNHTLEWDLGDVKAGAGFSDSKPRSVSFAIGLVPSTSQLGSMPELVYGQILNAIDSYTGEEILSSAPKVDTRTSRDSGFSNGDASVVK